VTETEGVQIAGPAGDRYDEILTADALALVSALHRELAPRRAELLAARARRQQELIAGANLDFLPQTREVRADRSWQVASPAPGLVDRRVEITGPTEKKMTINALNSGAKVWLADFEDANTPLWDNMITGQLNLKDALDRTVDFTSPDGKAYRLRPDEELATIVVRPRGWHLDEKHLLVDGRRASGSLVDFALYFAHCARRQLDKGKGPYFYLAKIESHLEARLWNDAFNLAQDRLGLPRGTIRATVLIETIPAAFEMEEILYELREHSAGLNAGRWDYLFSVIKKFRTRGRDFVLPERNAVTMTAPFMRAYTELLVKTCHGRGAHAMGGMAAFIPSRRDPEVNEKALAKVREDKTRESSDGFDLLAVDKTPGGITEAGLRNNVSVGLQYLASWLAGNGAVAIFNLMEDAATAEISRSQVWQWLHNDVTLAEGQPVTRDLVERIIGEELALIREQYGDAFDAARFDEAVALFKEVALADDYADFLTIPAYERMP
jgi:malate synthase